MSEFINNSTRHKEAVKDILKQLHGGTPLEEVKDTFADLLSETNAPTITEVEQMLINDGMPVEEIQRLCDVHVALFREALDGETPPEMIPGHPVYTFHMENEACGLILANLRRLIDALKKEPAKTELLKDIQLQARKLHHFERHYLRKENLLFPYLEKSDFAGPSTVMWGIHNEIRADWKKLSALAEGGAKSEVSPTAFAQKLDEVLRPIESAMSEMIYKEEKILFPAALERLSERDWAAIRAQEDEVGYSYVRPGTQWQAASQYQPSPASTAAAPQPEKAPPFGVDALINLETGALSQEQLNMMVKMLPVDITFVDENDRVRFFSNTAERVFPRSAAIIGREVQKCHPPQSLDRVQQILDDFRAGKRDQAEFWIEMGGKFIYINYFAMHDDSGRYRGTLEVTQEISHLRSLKGERRILDE